MTASLQPHAVGLTWHETDTMGRAAHAVRSGERVWLIDPFDDAAALAAAADLGRPAGVIQLLDRHKRDGAAIAARLGVQLLVLPRALPDTPFEVVSVVDRPWWHEIALWWAAQSTLIVAEAIGTGPLFTLSWGASPPTTPRTTTLDRRRAGVHPMLRALPPRSALDRYSPERLLVGHGAALDGDGGPALQEALSSSRSDIPRLLSKLPSILRGG